MPLAVSANRNEFLARPSQPWSLWPEEEGAPRIAAPRDLQGGGTWQGVNQRGLFACITNRRGAQLSSARRSRGELVARALGCATLDEARRRCAEVEGSSYNGFHLLVSDRHQAFVALGDGARVELRELPRGLHVITERSFGAGEGERELKVRAEFVSLFSRGVRSLESLRAPMQRHSGEEAPLEAACVHAEAFGYGTRSSFQLLLTDHAAPRALFSEGHPCVTEPVDISALLAPLFAQGLAREDAR